MKPVFIITIAAVVCLGFILPDISATSTHTISIPQGTAVPGCETTNACFSPAMVSINAGDTVEWVNEPTAAHTVTGGSPAMGPSGGFDSSLLMANANYAFTFDEAGSYDYFCMIHPWMSGTVIIVPETPDD